MRFDHQAHRLDLEDWRDALAIFALIAVLLPILLVKWLWSQIRP